MPSWAPAFSPYAHFNQVPPLLVQAEFRRRFADWGWPGTVRVDNGSPWGSWSDWPPALALWLIGSGVAMHWNDPCRPQQNGVVERSQGTGKRWAEPQECDTVAELQTRLDADDRRQREDYPYAQQQSRWEFYPALAHSGRPYEAATDDRRCDLEAVLSHLAAYVVPRQVDASGTISIWNRTHYVGPRYAGQKIFVHLDPLECQWVFSTLRGEQIRVKPAKELTVTAILALEVAGTK